MSGVSQRSSGGVQRAGVPQLEADAWVLRVTFHIDQGVVACVAAVVVGAMLLAHGLQANELARKAVGADQVACGQAHVADVEQMNHGGS